MCHIHEKTYIFPDGTRKPVQSIQFCHQSDRRTRCRPAKSVSHETIVIQEPGLTEDDGFSGPSSPAYPSTPDSANIETRLPTGGLRRASSSKRRMDASKLRVSFRDSSATAGAHRHARSSSSRSNDAGSEVSNTSAPPSSSILSSSPIGGGLSGFTARAPRSPTSGPRERLRPIVTEDFRPNPPPASSGSSSRSRSTAEEREPRISSDDRRLAEKLSEREKRHHRRRQEKGESSKRQQESGSNTISGNEARIVAEAEEARKEHERLTYRDELRRQKKDDDLREQRRRSAADRLEKRSSSMEGEPSGSQERPSSDAYDEHLGERVNQLLNDTNESLAEQIEADRRRRALQEQISARRPLEERPRSGESDAEGGRRAARYSSEENQQAAHERQRRQWEDRRPQQHYESHAYGSGAAFGDSHERGKGPAMPSPRHPQGQAHPSDGRSWHREEINPRGPPRRTNSQRSPGAPPSTIHGLSRPTSQGRRQSFSNPNFPSGSTPPGESRRPGSSSSSNPVYAPGYEEWKRRGEQILQGSRGRVQVQEMDPATRVVLPRDAHDRMQSERRYSGQLNPEQHPEDWYRSRW